MAMSRSLRWTTVALYAVTFCMALPVVLWWLGALIDQRWHLAWTPRMVGWLVFGTGGAVMVAAMLTLWREGRGLPVSALPPPRLARGGPYRFARHPIYLGFNVALLGLGLGLGSPGLTLVVAPLFLPAWLAYAHVEERGLERRFGDRYHRYRRAVQILPHSPVYEISRLVARAQAVRLEGVENIPPEGPAVLVANHCCYLDPLYVGLATSRYVRYVATAEMFRRPLLRLYSRGCGAVPTRRYRTDPAACREVQRLIAREEIVGLFAEGERSPLGVYQGAQPALAHLLSRLPCPVIPVGLSGNYDCGPRWAGVLRRRPLLVRVGTPITWNDEAPASTLDTALRALIDSDPQPIHLAGLPLERLERVLWRCPTCFDEVGWNAAHLACHTCGTRYTPTAEGGLTAGDGSAWSLADLGQRVRDAPETAPLVHHAEAWHEDLPHGDPRPLRRLGRASLTVDTSGLSFADMHLATASIQSVSTERADTLQVATRTGMWQFRPQGGSVFRLAGLLERGRQAAMPSAQVQT